MADEPMDLVQEIERERDAALADVARLHAEIAEHRRTIRAFVEATQGEADAGQECAA